MGKGIVQIGVDLVRREIACGPGQTPDQNQQLSEVAGASSYASVVGGGKVDEGHGEYAIEGATYPQLISPSTAPDNRYNRTEGQLAQLDSCPRGWNALRILWVATLAAFIFLRWSGFAMTALLLGQFAEAAVEYRRVYGRKRAPRRGSA